MDIKIMGIAGSPIKGGNAESYLMEALLTIITALTAYFGGIIINLFLVSVRVPLITKHQIYSTFINNAA